LKRPRKHGVNEVVIIKITSLLLLSWSGRVHCVLFLNKNLKRFWLKEVENAEHKESGI
jgi:hypothetical protein